MSGSPPEKVIPPLAQKYSFCFSAWRRMSSALRCLALSFSSGMVSGLWQYLHLNMQPCKKITSLIPGPSWVAKVSIECTLSIVLSIKNENNLVTYRLVF
jgi:hypothetical protein